MRTGCSQHMRNGEAVTPGRDAAGMDAEEITQEDIDALAQLEDRARERAEAEIRRRSEAMTAAMRFSSLGGL